MSDLISRQAVIYALNEQAETMSHWNKRYEEQRIGVLTAVNIVECVPSIDAVKRGRWVVDPEGMLHCSNCKEIPTNRIVVNADLIYDMTNIKEAMKYCPKCGARMGEEECQR